MNRPEAPPHPTLPRDRWTAWLLVAGQFALLAMIIVLPGSTGWTLPVGLAVADRAAEVVGILVMVGGATALGRGLTAAPLPNEHAQLRTGGIYHYVRHPIYSGVLLIVLINVKARWEEGHLTRRFPDYLGYGSRTPRFIPSLNRH